VHTIFCFRMRSSGISYNSNNNNTNSSSTNGTLTLSPNVVPNTTNNMHSANNTTGLNAPVGVSSAISNNTCSSNNPSGSLSCASHNATSNNVSGSTVNTINHAPLPPNFTSPFLQSASHATGSTNNGSLPIVYQVTASSYKREQNSRSSSKANISVLMKIYIWFCSAFMLLSRVSSPMTCAPTQQDEASNNFFSKNSSPGRFGK